MLTICAYVVPALVFVPLAFALAVVEGKEEAQRILGARPKARREP